MTRHRALALLLSAFALTACDKTQVQDLTGPVPGGVRIRFFNFGVNAPGVNFYANTQKMTAILSATGAESTTGVASGGAGSGGWYSALEAGQYTLAGKIAAAVDKDLAISTVSTSLEDKKYYSFIMSGFYDATAKNVEGFIIEDPIPAEIDYSQAYVRFVNAISNSQPMTLYAKNTTTNAEVALGAAVSYKGAGAFTAVPMGIYDLNTRVTGSATNVITRTGLNFIAGHMYTVGARGDITVVSTTAATRPQLDNSPNR